MSAAVLDQHIRQIRNIQICRQDLEPLLPDKQMKIPSSLINAFGAYLQKVLDDAPDGIDDPAIFSSWLGPIVTGTIKDGGIEGSFNEHVLAAVSNIFVVQQKGLNFIIEQCYTGTKEELLTRTRWVIPLCLDKVPARWVLGCADFSKHEITIYDSSPELCSSYRATPVRTIILIEMRALTIPADP
jgi:hypothetical protein